VADLKEQLSNYMTPVVPKPVPIKEPLTVNLWSEPMTNPGSGKPIEILLVEDNPDDAFMTMEGLREGKVRNNVHLVEDGVEALRCLRRQGPGPAMPQPDLILLDLSLPRLGGLEVLAEIKQDAELRQIPVVIMTGSKREEDVLRAYNNHANCYVTKPLDVDQFLGVVRKIEDFWLTVVKLPRAA
jgi:CheY-like chemotaxis protein